MKETDKCVALGRDKDGVNQPIILKPVTEDCQDGSRCFSRVTKLAEECKVSKY